MVTHFVFNLLNFRKMRRQLTGMELRRAARKPWRKLNVKGVDDMVVVLD